jgi:hypothetical protein
MKALLFGILIFGAQQSFACVELNNAKYCIGDKVYKGTSYPNAAVISYISSVNGNVSVQTRFEDDTAEYTFSEDPKDLDITNGCFEDVCIQDNVHRGTLYPGGGAVVGINPTKKTVTIAQAKNNALAVIKIKDLHVEKGCVNGICVGDIVYTGSVFEPGVKVIAVNAYFKTILVKARFQYDDKDFVFEQFANELKLIK